jgi:hypothetical protein
MRAETAAFALTQRLRRRYGRRRLNDRRRTLHADRCDRIAATRRAALAEILAAHRHGAVDALRADEHTRRNAIGLDWPARCRADERGRNARIDADAAAGTERTVDDHGRAQQVTRPRRRHEISAHARRRDVAGLDKGPVGRIVAVFLDHVVGR